jgi:hypothetical protein
MILVSGRTIPVGVNWDHFDRIYRQPSESKLQWKIQAYLDAEKKRKEKELEKKMRLQAANR